MSANYLEPDQLILREGENVDSVLICSICQGIIVNPQECRACQRSFCLDCINQWRTRSDHCPNLCKKPLYVQSHLVVRNLLDKLVFRCRNSACKENLSYASKIKRDHESNCEVEHSDSLLRLNGRVVEINCTFCDVKFPPKEIKEHEAKCTAAERNMEGRLEICFGCNKNTDEFEQCSNCKGLFCNLRCTFSCKKCNNLTCFKQCGSRCNCQANLFCNKCRDEMEVSEKICGICTSRYTVRCEDCKKRTDCDKCKKEVCRNCQIFCERCEKVSCLECSWTCFECKLYKCSCAPKVNYFTSTMWGMYYGFKDFFVSSDIKSWNVALRWIYFFFVAIIAGPIFVCVVLIYFILGGLLAEWTNSICTYCRDSYYGEVAVQGSESQQ